jgi:vancomycin resistance protein YoaR
VTVSRDTTLRREPEEREKSGGKAVLFVLFALLVLAGGAYAAAYLVAGDKVPRGTTIGGVEVGGRTQAAAARALERGLRQGATAPMEVTAGEATRSVLPETAGLSVDYAASVAEAGARRSWEPRWLWDYFTGGDDLEPVVSVDEAAQEAFLSSLGEEVGTPAREGTVRFVRSGFRVTEARTGETLDMEAAAEAIRAAYLTEPSAVDLPMVTVQPDIDASDVAEAVNGFANPAVSAPVTLVFGDARARLTPRDYAPALSLEPQGGELVPVVDTDRLGAQIGDVVEGGGAPVDAQVRLVGGVPRVIPSRPGVTYEPAAVHAAFLDLVTRPQGERELAVESTVARPEFTTKEARALRITERVSTFTTYFPHADYRNTNIGRAAELVSGTLLEPGETFSLNETVGERTAENGFTEGFIISDGIFKEELGGGVSQMATTTFNAAFFAGMTDVEHKPHSFFIDRYPVGREATVAWPTVDLKFRNDTPYGVLVSASVTPSTPSSSGAVTVSMWSTKYWDITTRTGQRYNYTEPQTRRLRTEDCYPNEGYGGFDVDVWRYFRRAGQSELVDTEKMHTTYTPSDTVICLPPED